MAEEKEYDLKKSIEGLGVLVPIIKNKRTGHTVDGRHREQLGFKTPIYEIDIPEELEPIARLAINNVRRNADKDEEEWRDTLSKFVGIEGKKPQELADLTGVSLSTIYRHLPQSLKPSGEKISEGLKKEYEIARQEVALATPTIKTQDNTTRLDAALGRDATKPANLVECERCHTFVGKENIHEWHKHNLCDKHFERAELNPEVYDGYFRYVERAKNHQVPPKLLPSSQKPQEKWENRLAKMKVSPSKMDELMTIRLHNSEKLRNAGWHVESQVVYTKILCVSDNTLVNDKLDKRIAVFYDFPETHKNKDLEDDAKRMEAGILHNFVPLPLPYNAATETECARLLKEIEAKALQEEA